MERLRPVATTDDLESFSEALRFCHPPAATAALDGVALPRPPREALATFAGEAQSGSVEDLLFAVAALVISAQARKAQGMPSWIILAGRKFGYDLA